MVKSAKRALNAIVGSADLKDEELMTALIGVEALMNSRPLTYQSAHPGDDVPLTPNHFLHGQVGGEFPPSSVDDTGFNPRRRWRRVQEVPLHFWQRWMREFLPTLRGFLHILYLLVLDLAAHTHAYIACGGQRPI